ncbi:MAG: CotH kinase family protein [Lachnospiraceae bacterium]|nr:CotH kinase family protein [Lachnospiraceae bacterium]
MKKFLWKCMGIVMAAAFIAGCADAKPTESTKPQTSSMETMEENIQTEQTEMEIPSVYESFGIKEHDIEIFRTEVSKNVELPIINVITGGEEILSREEYVSCAVDVFNCEESQMIEGALAGIRVRGNSSAYYGDVDQIRKNTVPYRIKFDSKTNLLGMNDGAECKSWVLLKSDGDLIRNDIAFRFGRTIIGDNAYCSDARFVHLYVNNEFQGVYLLCEQCQINKNRVDITEPEEGYTGTDIGYYFELDNYTWAEPDNPFIRMDYGGYAVTDIEGETREFVPAEYSIKNDVYTQEQIDFADKYLNNVFEIVYRACEKGEYLTFDENYDLVESGFDNAEDTVRAVMDVQSVVDMYLLYEIVHDYDCGEGSFYMCVDFAKDSTCPKLQFTSPWDFNWAYDGSTDRYWAAAFCEQSFADEFGDRSNPWFIVLMKQDWFAELAEQKWTQLQSEGKIDACIEEEIRLLEAYKDDLNKERESAVDSAYWVLEWIENRIDWMDETFLKK